MIDPHPATQDAPPRGSRVRRPSWRARSGRTTIALVVALVASFRLGPACAAPFEYPHTLSDEQQRRVVAQIDTIGRRGFLYEVSRPVADGSPGKRLFLYGTIHLGRIGSEPFNKPLMKALRASRRLALEADPTDLASTQAMARKLGTYPDGDSLRRHLSPALMARVTAFGQKNGIPDDRVERFRPWLLANMVALAQMSDAGLDATLGSELYLSGFARGMRLPIVEIEGMDAQLRLLATLPDDLQTAQLDEALTDLDDATAQVESKALFDLWLDGDRATGDAMVDELHRDAGTKVFEHYFVERLLDARNRTMADKAESYLERPGNTFFAVGSLHLFGETGLIREFERRGYRVVDLQPPIATRP